MDGAADTVHQLGVNLGRHVVVVHRRFVQIPDGRRFDYVADDVLLDTLVLGHTASTVGTPYITDMAATMLRSSTVSPFLRHLPSFPPQEATW